jgi:hypothetical protein
MANEIRVTAGLTLNNSPISFSKNISVAADQTTKRGPNPGSVTVSTTTTTVSFGNLSNPGWALMTNSGTNPIEIVISKVLLNSNQAHIVQLANSATVTINTTAGTSTLHIDAIDK